MKKKLSNNVFCSISFFLFQIFMMQGMYGMDDLEVHVIHDKLQSIKNVLMKKKYDYDQDRLRIVLEHNPDIFDFHMLHSLSEVSSTCYRIVELTRQYRKNKYDDHRELILLSEQERRNCFLILNPHLKTFLNYLTWNKANTACARVIYGTKLTCILSSGIKQYPICSNRTALLIERLFLRDSEFVSDYKFWENFYKDLPCRSQLFVNGKKEVSFYACGIYMIDGKAYRHVLEYSLPEKEKGPFICAVQINDNMIPLANFLEFPMILQAFLESSQSRYHEVRPCKIFMLEGVHFPDNYQQHQQYFKDYIKYKSFKKLSKKIRTTIVAHYNAQQKTQESTIKKKNTGLLNCFGN